MTDLLCSTSDLYYVGDDLDPYEAKCTRQVESRMLTYEDLPSIFDSCSLVALAMALVFSCSPRRSRSFPFLWERHCMSVLSLA
ncbi:hypothetical protein MPTK1_7g14190 [Marchantia polymorpha subsp. ruderalis]|uniref:Uncharacterized protein n=2 Tax=Marchantia polymorpha TaxID=3197 RepID=A0AAF6BZG1_MARPO|nr:hypothetical protein MARPO_0009s0104 [Marchantia polymorpha]BBN17395.1 hypothetical protein Mp_7g14190 [Marchantia polymorpha subsp. ruderalis]|eukprot:PTQ47000.1 hypothetical protein MARPO_0009s0104 [Marchantia polymorpha]